MPTPEDFGFAADTPITPEDFGFVADITPTAKLVKEAAGITEVVRKAIAAEKPRTVEDIRRERIGGAAKLRGKVGPFQTGFIGQDFDTTPRTPHEKYVDDLRSIYKSPKPAEEKETLSLERTRNRFVERVGEIQQTIQQPHIQKEWQEENKKLRGKFLAKTYRRWERGAVMVRGGGLHLIEELTRAATLGKYGDTAGEWARMYHDALSSPQMQPVVENTFDKYFGGGIETGPFIGASVVPALATSGATIPSSIGGFLVAYGVEGNNAYQAALDRGESEESARIRGILVGMINGGIEVAGGSGAKYYKKNAANAAIRKMSGVERFTRRVLRTALQEGLKEEVPQEIVSMVVGGDVPKDAKGNVDWGVAVDRIIDAGIMGTIIGGIYSAPGTLAGTLKMPPIENGKEALGELKDIAQDVEQEPSITPEQKEQALRYIGDIETTVEERLVDKFPNVISDQESLEKVGNEIAKELGIEGITWSWDTKHRGKWAFYRASTKGITIQPNSIHWAENPGRLWTKRGTFVDVPNKTPGKLNQDLLKRVIIHELGHHVVPSVYSKTGRRISHGRQFADWVNEGISKQLEQTERVVLPVAREEAIGPVGEQPVVEPPAQAEKGAVFEEPYTGEEVAQYLKDLGTHDDDGTGLPVMGEADSWMLATLKEKKEFVLTDIDLDKLVASDPSMASYIEDGIDRWEGEEDVLDLDTLTDPIIIGSWPYDREGKAAVLDGMNRTFVRYKNGERVVRAYVEKAVKDQVQAGEKDFLARQDIQPPAPAEAATEKGAEKKEPQREPKRLSRKKLLARGHIMPKQLGFDDATRRDMQEKITGKRSMAEMNKKEMTAWVEYLETEFAARGRVFEEEVPVVDQILERLAETTKGKEGKVRGKRVTKLIKAFKSVKHGIYYDLIRVERLLEALDGYKDGPLHKYLWSEVKASDEMRTESVNREQGHFISLLEDKGIDTTLWTGKTEQVRKGLELTPFQRIGTYLLSRNRHGMRYLVKGMGITTHDVETITKMMGEDELAVANWMSEQYEQQWNIVQAVAIEAGVDPKNLEQELLYSPILRSDIDFSDQVDFLDVITEQFNRESYKPEQGFLKKRQERAIGELELDAGVIYMYNIVRVESFKTMAPLARDMGRIFHNSAFKKAINEATDGNGARVLNTWLRHTIKGGLQGPSTWYEKAIAVLRRNGIVYAIGWNIPSSLRQALSMTNAMAVDPKMWKFIPRNIIRSIKDYSSLRKEVEEKSLLVKTRDFDRDLRTKWTTQTLQKKLAGKDPFDRRATRWIRAIDKRTVVIAWKSLYDVAFEKNGGDETAALAFADKWVARTQPMANMKDLPHFFRGGQIAKLVSAFQNQVNNNGNFYAHDILGMRKAGKINNQMVAYRIMMSYILPSMIYGIIGRGGLPDDWEDIATDLITYPIAPLMLVGRLINRAIRGWGNSGTTAEIAPEEFMRTIESAKRGDIGGMIRHAAATVGAATGRIPAQAIRTTRGVIDLVAGTTNDPRRLIYSQWALGQGQKKKPAGGTRRPIAKGRRRK